MSFTLNGQEHTVGDRRCSECYANWPKLCQCKGLIHAQFVKEHWQGELDMVFSCDNCGDQYKYPVPKPAKTKFAGKARRKPKWKKTK